MKKILLALLLLSPVFLRAQFVLESTTNTATTQDAVQIPINAPWGVTADGRQARFKLNNDGTLASTTILAGTFLSGTANVQLVNGSNLAVPVTQLQAGALGTDLGLNVKGAVMGEFGASGGAGVFSPVNSSLHTDAYIPGQAGLEVNATLTGLNGVSLSAANPIPFSGTVSPTANNLFRYLVSAWYANALSISPTNAVSIVGGPNGLANNSAAIPFAVQLSQANALISALNPTFSNTSLFNGSTYESQRNANIFKPLSAVSTNAAATFWTPTGGKKFRLMKYHLTSSVAGNVTLFDGAVTITVVPSGAGGSGVFVDLGNGYLSTTINQVLSAVGPAASTTSGVLGGTEE